MFRLAMTLVLFGASQTIAGPPTPKVSESGVPYGISISAEVEYVPGGVKDVTPFNVYSINGKALAKPVRWNVEGIVERRRTVRGVLERRSAGGGPGMGLLLTFFDSLRLEAESPPQQNQPTK